MSGLKGFLKTFEDTPVEEKPEEIKNSSKKNLKIGKIKLNIKKEKPKENVQPKNAESIQISHAEQRPSVNKKPTRPSQKKVTEEDIERMFLESETKIEFKEEWMETYHRGLRSTKKNNMVRKIVNGRFRISDGGKMEIMADMKTHDMSSMELLNKKWL